VKSVQTKVGVKADGDFGPKTEAAVKVFQKKNSLTADGLIGPKTWAKMF
jgi:peptidoglycan hydrolase-like protein with peptidoglycan-binding domain